MAAEAATSPDFALDGDESGKAGTKSAPKRPAECPRFDRWWREYPKRQDRLNALKAWHKNGCAAIADQIIAGTMRLKGSSKWKAGFVPMATTFLNGARWEDEGDAPARVPQKSAYHLGTTDPHGNGTYPGIADATMAGLNLLLLNVMLAEMGNVPDDCMAQLLRKRNQIREWIGDRILSPDDDRRVAARAKQRFLEIIHEFNFAVGARGQAVHARRAVPSARALAAEGADLVGDAF